jgi:hypothetical protein
VDRDGAFGELFSNRAGSPHQPEFLAGGSASELILPSTIRRLIVLDKDLSRAFDPAIGLHEIHITGSRSIWVLEGEDLGSRIALYHWPINVKKSP